ncbi:hypothetical protein TNCT_229871 [Trichonephila clavata]|uniref:Uncharacterized protein n=1 Tax=Trichonephila clavata TaxID=2740835 RepID=A0A8X6M458_TRICU|nr:hypothetical protein TNCT_229871 [Trichonephila clavata]
MPAQDLCVLENLPFTLTANLLSLKKSLILSRCLRCPRNAKFQGVLSPNPVKGHRKIKEYGCSFPMRSFLKSIHD